MHQRRGRLSWQRALVGSRHSLLHLCQYASVRIKHLVETDAHHLEIAKEEQQAKWLHTPSEGVYIRAMVFDTFMDGVEVVPARRAQRLGGKEQGGMRERARKVNSSPFDGLAQPLATLAKDGHGAELIQRMLSREQHRT